MSMLQAVLLAPGVVDWVDVLLPLSVVLLDAEVGEVVGARKTASPSLSLYVIACPPKVPPDSSVPQSPNRIK